MKTSRPKLSTICDCFPPRAVQLKMSQLAEFVRYNSKCIAVNATRMGRDDESESPISLQWAQWRIRVIPSTTRWLGELTKITWNIDVFISEWTDWSECVEHRQTRQRQCHNGNVVYPLTAFGPSCSTIDTQEVRQCSPACALDIDQLDVKMMALKAQLTSIFIELSEISKSVNGTTCPENVLIVPL